MTRNAAEPADRYAVFGNPIAHSRSPWIHRRFARQTGQTLQYEAILAPLDGFAGALAAFERAGGRGANVTLPFKEEAWRLCGERTVHAEQAGAVNTLVLRADGLRLGDNTDGVGLVRDLTANLGLSLAGLRILLLGAGGAARGIVAPLLEGAPELLHIANRTAERAVQLAHEHRRRGPVVGGGLDALAQARFDLVLNATSSGHGGGAPALPDADLCRTALCYDLTYGAAAAPFLNWARAHGARRISDGAGMLVEQAAESFARWRGVRPHTGEVIDALRRELAGG